MKTFVTLFFLFFASNVFSQNNSDLESLMFKFIENRELRKLDSLLQFNVNINGYNSNQETPLMIACKGYNINLQIIHLLINKGADILYVNKETESSAISYCIDYINPEVTGLLLSKIPYEQKVDFFEDISYPFYCTFSGDYKSLKLILPFYQKRITEKYIDLSLLESAIKLECSVNELFSVPYMTEGKQRLGANASILILEMLIKNGANVNEENHYGIPIVFQSVCSPRGLRKLVEHGANVNAADNSHDTSYSILQAFIDKISTPKVFIDNEAIFLNTKKQIHSSLELIDMMVKKGAKLQNGYDNPYQYLLMKAVTNNNLNLLKILLEKGYDINFFDLEGKTLLMHASENNYTKIIDLLINNGAR